MSRALSIHIGVDTPRRFADRPLGNSERNAWRMAGLAEQAGYDSILLLRGSSATRQAVHDALTRAAGALGGGDTLFVSFAGHGSRERDDDRDEGHGWDEAWCLYDGEMVDDRLSGYWQLFEPGVRILVVTESCYGGGMGRDDEERQGAGAPRPREPGMPGTGYGRRDGGLARPAGAVVMRGGGSGYRGPAAQAAGAADYAGSCIAEAPRDTHGIRASLLLLSASGEDQTAREGLYTEHLLQVWAGGTFRGSYCDLHRVIRNRVTTERCAQEPQLLMLGAGDPAFPLEPAFHLDRRGARRDAVYRS